MRFQRVPPEKGTGNRPCIIFYIVSFYTWQIPEVFARMRVEPKLDVSLITCTCSCIKCTLLLFWNLLKLRYRVRGMTSQENDRHSPCPIINLATSTLLSLAKNPGKVYVSYVTSIKCYIRMYRYHFIHWQVYYNMLMSRYHFIHCLWCIICYSVLYQSFPQVFPQVVENFGVSGDTCACIICTWQFHRLLPKSAIRFHIIS